jgi:uncharacterized protein (DUF1501 family)
MDPYVESSGDWPDFHLRFITHCAEQLADRLPRNYRARAQERQVGDSLRAFIDDLSAAGEARRVLVFVFSEFGRRLSENASGGTDHGTAAPVLIVGPAVRQPLIGPYPDLRGLDLEGDPQHAIDFRRVYAELLDTWLDCPSEPILGERFDPLRLIEPS